MRKREWILFLIIFSVILFSNFAASQTEHTAEINKAFQCLDGKVAGTSLSLEEAVFSALARVPNNKVNDTINSKKSGSAFCWPSEGCTVKDTAQVALAKIALGQNVGNITSWLRTQKGVAQDLTWYLQISADNNAPAQCAVNYDGSDHTVKIDDAMKLSGSPGSCLTPANSNYWLRINTACLEKEFSVQCNSSFKTNLLYEKNTGGTIYVSSQTHGAAAGAWTVEAITAKCFKQGSACNYEGSLWAAVALYANGEDYSEFVPYLRALSADNKKYFPSAFLVAILQGGDNHYAEIIQSQKFRPEGGYWEMSNTAYNKFYDTSLAMLSFGGANAPEIQSSNVLGYLFSKQDTSGCWNGDNLRDTAFIIWSAKWIRTPGQTGGFVCGDGMINGTEQCDGTNLASATCISRGYSGGNLSCTSTCTFNVGSCTSNVNTSFVCGDGMINGTEQCDGTNLNNQTCASRGYSSGNLGCMMTGANACTYNVSSCQINTNPPGPVGPGGGCTANSNCSSGSCVNGTCISSGGGGGGGLTDCELRGLFCVPSMSDCLDVGGTFYPQSTHSCYNPFEYCCTRDVAEPNCASLGGSVCIPDEETCSGSIVSAEDGACCLDSCIPYGGTTDQCAVDDDCTPGRICLGGECVLGDDNNGGTTTEGGSSWWIWIALLLILILLLVLGIVYRTKLKLWWLKTRGKTKTSKIGPSDMPPVNPLFRRPVPRFGMPGRPPMNAGRPVPPSRPPMRTAEKKEEPKKGKNDEEEETFKKLREMSK